MSGVVLHLRSETKPLEHRSALTPSTTKALLDAGYTINVEKSPVRIFDDSEFEAVGATLVPEASWPEAPDNHIIIGLKELPEHDTFPLKHTHIQFAHCFKNQAGWQDVLSRFPRGGGTLLDLEFLAENGRRVSAFGYHAGFAGAALAVQTWSLGLEGSDLAAVKSYQNDSELLASLRKYLQKGIENAGRQPRVLVIGALGRCGRGAVDLCEKIGIDSDNIVKWDLPETAAKSGPYQEIIDSDIFVNCIYLTDKIPPFVDVPSLNKPGRRLSVICDVSCDTTNPNNPVPVYTINTTFDRPTIKVETAGQPTLRVISIDHLPSLLPREASESFSKGLLPSLLKLKDRGTTPVWQDAEKLFREKCGELPSLNGANGS